jgi:GNAT superfamily N-acetyltransferase
MSKQRILVRRPTSNDVGTLGNVIFRAFASIADRHNFPRDFPSADHGANLARMLVEHPGFFGAVAEIDGRIVGCNFLDQRDEIGGVGPMTIDPDFQGNGLGRQLMQAVIGRGQQMRGVRLVQDAFNTTSMALYAALGFDAVEPLALMTGKPRDAKLDPSVRPLGDADAGPAADLCRRVHGISRVNEVRDAIGQFKPFVRERDGRIVAYCTAPSIWLINHGVAETEDDLRSLLLGAAGALDAPLALLVPTRRADFFRWCLEQEMRMVKPMTLMKLREYHEPRGAFYPSVIY